MAQLGEGKQRSQAEDRSERIGQAYLKRFGYVVVYESRRAQDSESWIAEALAEVQDRQQCEVKCQED